VNFQEAIELAKSRSDCHPNNIIDLTKAVSHVTHIPGDIVEVGSYKCGASIAMAATVLEYQRTPRVEKRVYAFDTFGGLPYGEGVGFENFANTDWEEIKETVKPFEIVLVRGKHEDTIPTFPPRPLSLIFMDSDHYSSHQVALTHFWPMLSHDGIVVFHDWAFPGVQAAVNEVIPKEDFIELGGYETSPNMKFIKKV